MQKGHEDREGGVFVAERDHMEEMVDEREAGRAAVEIEEVPEKAVRKKPGRDELDIVIDIENGPSENGKERVDCEDGPEE
jgi:hypothetical protein